TQVQVNNKAGLTFATGLRSTLRSDPDVILVGEIRDKETAKISIEAAMTGHLVLSTLHTNDAASTITRLIEMGVEAFLVASSVDVIVAQRLCRVLCSSCKRPVAVTGEVLAEHGFMAADDMDAFEPVGCTRCGGTGYRGRVNASQQRSAVGAAFRLIPTEIPALETLGLPPVVKELVTRPRGLVLVTGPTGSGKSTSLAAMLDVINATRDEHIMTVEDPI